MAVVDAVFREINTLTAELIEAGLSSEQNFPVLKRGDPAGDVVTFSGDNELSFILKNIAYEQIYAELRLRKSFSIQMLDGALLQMQYIVSGDVIRKHRLAFFPAPDLQEYQNNPRLYEDDEIYAEVMMKNIVTSPIRFDFDRDAFVEDLHPMSHLTIGQYKNCRIPVGGPLSPYLFIHFILKSFYNTAYRKHTDNISKFDYSFSATITPREQRHVHLTAAVKA